MGMTAKHQYELDEGVVGRLTISLDVPKSEREILKIKGYGDQEIDNLIGQKYQEILYVLGLTDGNGV